MIREAAAVVGGAILVLVVMVGASHLLEAVLT